MAAMRLTSKARGTSTLSLHGIAWRRCRRTTRTSSSTPKGERSIALAASGSALTRSPSRWRPATVM